MSDITTACIDMAGTTVADEGSVLAAFTAAAAGSGLVPGAPGYDQAFQRNARHANAAFENSYAESVRAGLVTALPGAIETITALRAAGIRVCLATGFSPVTRDTLLDALGWRPLIDLALSPADAGRGRPWPDLPLTALLRLGGGAVSELAVVGDTASDVQSGLRAGAGVVAGVLSGSGSREDLEQAGATHILDAVTGLVPLLGIGGFP